ncbi:MAG TPA: disulfide bond formation protein B [Caulobacteraceae bacterium]|nr:disulfide bond formation protein B [Caulobacteraceae bacterium]
MAILDAILKRWPIFAFVISAAMLGVAHGFQTFGHLAPCHLCLQQREVYWAALGVSGLAGLAMALRLGARAPRIASVILAAIFAYGVYLAGFHAGAEWKWWPAPVTCASGGPAVTAADIKALLAGAEAKAPACDRAPWRFLGLSMAGWNFVASLGLVGLSLAAAARKEQTQ